MSRAGGEFEPVCLAVTVAESPGTPSIGSAAPRSRNLIARDVQNLRQIDTSPQPHPRACIRYESLMRWRKESRNSLSLQRRSSALAACVGQSSISFIHCCQPTANGVAFIHQEIWQDFADKKVFPTVEEWRLFTEPWIFVVDGQGIVRGEVRRARDRS